MEVTRPLSVTLPPPALPSDFGSKIQELINENKNLSSQVQYLVRNQSQLRTTEDQNEEDFHQESDQRFFQKATFKNPVYKTPEENPKQHPNMSSGLSPFNPQCSGQQACFLHSGYASQSLGFQYSNGFRSNCLQHLQQYIRPSCCCSQDLGLKTSYVDQKSTNQKENFHRESNDNNYAKSSLTKNYIPSFYVDRKGVLFTNSTMNVIIRQAKPFEDQIGPHLKFYLTFQNQTENLITNFNCSFKGQSKHYNLMVNSKKLAKEIGPGSEISLAFAIFPNQFPFEQPNLKMNYQIANPNRSDTIEESIPINIPFNKFIKFVPQNSTNSTEFALGSNNVISKTFQFSRKILPSLTDLSRLFTNLTLQNLRNSKSSNSQVFSGVFFFLLNSEQREYHLELHASEQSNQMKILLKSDYVSGSGKDEIQDQYLPIMADQFEELMKQKTLSHNRI
jgi:hypothetical protein